MTDETGLPATTAPNSPLTSLSNMRSALVSVASQMRSTGGDPFLRLLKDGTWVYGAENIEVEGGALWAINPQSIQHGYACWSKGEDGNAGELLGEAMVSLYHAKPNLGSLPEHAFPWTEQISFSLRCTNGEDKGVQVQYKVTSKGGMNAARVLLQQLLNQVDTDPANLVPVVELQSSYYNHKTWGRTYVPVLTIQSWSSEQALAGAEPAQAKAAETKAPAQPTVKRRNTAAAQSPQPAAAAGRRGKPEAPSKAPAQPVRRRR